MISVYFGLCGCWSWFYLRNRHLQHRGATNKSRNHFELHKNQYSVSLIELINFSNAVVNQLVTRIKIPHQIICLVLMKCFDWNENEQKRHFNYIDQLQAEKQTTHTMKLKIWNFMRQFETAITFKRLAATFFHSKLTTLLVYNRASWRLCAIDSRYGVLEVLEFKCWNFISCWHCRTE